ncbi:YbaK/prolyl-tRNA synthetase-like protein [Giardia muris]|uniref:YbaK/prolyl-tRNA synthetase-like protein n=1 Tax=Giardia muris TaxID=5742 RepID=A0A4Z1T1P9_GIAMU|nr:YbaK/prolyl-tRNA synthetase-like protein [Giardia muris]|eukprot:TNJ26479.1 YbaK/prolyl-tRNA synthetase-like protein [Giardia muris]
MERLQEKVSALTRLLGVPDDLDCLSVLALGYRQGFPRLKAMKTPTNYYDLPLERRPSLLDPCPSTAFLIKSIVLENTKAPLDARAPIFSRYYLILVQYVRRFSSARFHTAMRQLARTDPNYANLTKNDFTWRFADEETATALTGAPHNGIGPIGLRTPIPVVVDAAILELPYVWVGGLEPTTKVMVSVSDLSHILQPIIINCADNANSDANTPESVQRE